MSKKNMKPDDERMEVITQLVEIRRQQGISSEQLSAMSGFSLSCIQHMECGQHAPHFNTLKTIAETLGYRTVIKLEKTGA